MSESIPNRPPASISFPTGLRSGSQDRKLSQPLLVVVVLHATPPFPPDIVEQDLVVRDLVDLVALVALDPPLESSVERDSDPLSESDSDRLSDPSFTSVRKNSSVETADLVESIVLPLPSIFLPNPPNLPLLFPILSSAAPPSGLLITWLLALPFDL